MNKKEPGPREKAIRRLRFGLWCGVIYLVGAGLGIITGHFTGELSTRATLLWLLGSAVYLAGIAVGMRRLRRIRAGDPAASLGCDERQEYIAYKAGYATALWTVLILTAHLTGTWAETGRFPVETVVMLLLVLLIYSGYYLYYLRKYS